MSLLFRLISVPITGIVAALLSKCVNSGWRRVSGKEPPQLGDPEAKVAQLVIFEVLIAAVAATVSVLSTQFSAKHKARSKAR